MHWRPWFCLPLHLLPLQNSDCCTISCSRHWQGQHIKISWPFLKTIVPFTPSHLKNWQALINLLKNTTNPPSEEVFLISIDVKTLYTTNPQEEGINSLLQHNEITGLPKFVSRQLVNFILKHNTFTFDGQSYHQLTGNHHHLLLYQWGPLVSYCYWFYETVESHLQACQSVHPNIYQSLSKMYHFQICAPVMFQGLYVVYVSQFLTKCIDSYESGNSKSYNIWQWNWVQESAWHLPLSIYYTILSKVCYNY